MPTEIGPQVILAEWLFVETVADIRRRSQDPGARSRYELLGIAPLLRKLLLDGHPLVNTVRAGRPGVPTDFRVRQWNAPRGRRGEENLPYLFRLGGDELIGGPNYPALPNLKQFIGAKVGLVQGLPLTVRDVVRYYANVEGGVHFGKPATEAERIFNVMAPMLLGQTTGQIQILAHLGTIVADALTPLRESILSSPLIDVRIHQRNDRSFYEGHWTADHHSRIRQCHDPV